MRCILIAAALLAPWCSLVAQDSRPTSQPSAKKAKSRNGGFFGIRFAETRHDGRTVLAIESVMPGSDAERLGYEAGDLITGVEGRRLKDGDHFIRLLYGTHRAARRSARSGDRPFVTVIRDDKEIEIEGGLADLDATPKVGDRAPDFTLADADGENKVTLSKLVGAKPVVLVFGSYT